MLNNQRKHFTPHHRYVGLECGDHNSSTTNKTLTDQMHHHRHHHHKTTIGDAKELRRNTGAKSKKSQQTYANVQSSKSMRLSMNHRISDNTDDIAASSATAAAATTTQQNCILCRCVCCQCQCICITQSRTKHSSSNNDLPDRKFGFGTNFFDVTPFANNNSNNSSDALCHSVLNIYNWFDSPYVTDKHLYNQKSALSLKYSYKNQISSNYPQSSCSCSGSLSDDYCGTCARPTNNSSTLDSCASTTITQITSTDLDKCQMGNNINKTRINLSNRWIKSSLTSPTPSSIISAALLCSTPLLVICTMFLVFAFSPISGVAASDIVSSRPSTISNEEGGESFFFFFCVMV